MVGGWMRCSRQSYTNLMSCPQPPLEPITTTLSPGRSGSALTEPAAMVGCRRVRCCRRGMVKASAWKRDSSTIASRRAAC